MKRESIKSRELTREEFELHLQSTSPQHSRDLRGIELGRQPIPREVRSRELTEAEFKAHFAGHNPEESRQLVREASMRMGKGASVLMVMERELADEQPKRPSSNAPTLQSFPRMILSPEKVTNITD